MLDLEVLNLNSPTWPLVILLASLMGSAHCAGMCGPITVFLVKESKSHILKYHIGRLMAYLTLGSLAGLVGEFLFESFRVELSLAVSIFFSLVFVYLGLRLFNLNLPHSSRFWSSLIYRKFNQVKNSQSSQKYYTLGFLNGLIPCGWLYIFLIASTTVKSPLYGALFLFMFWMGTLPSLVGSFYIFQVLKNKIPFKTTMRFVGLSLLVMGIWNFGHAVESVWNMSSKSRTPGSEYICH